VCLICGHAPGRTNKRPHLLAKHSEVNSDKHPLVIEKLQAKNTGILQAMSKAPKATPINTRVIEFFAAHGLPHQLVESPYFRAMCVALSRSTDDVIKSRRTFASKMDDHSRETLHRMLTERANSAGYLRIDSGTVVHRYLCLVLHCATARPIVVSMIHDGAFEDGSLCTPNIVKGINSAVDLCAQFKIAVGAVVSDNCANVQEESAECGRIPIRCQAHSIQLVVKDALTHPSWVQIVSYYEKFKQDNESEPAQSRSAPNATSH
jgi:hypothetical protein